jgi:hypothetical protein
LGDCIRARNRSHDADREWFLVPLQVINEAVQHIRDGTVTALTYDPSAARLVDCGP